MYNFVKSRNTRNQECFTHPAFVKNKKFKLKDIQKKFKQPSVEKQRQDESYNGEDSRMGYEILSLPGGNNQNLSIMPAKRVTDYEHRVSDVSL